MLYEVITPLMVYPGLIIDLKDSRKTKLVLQLLPFVVVDGQVHISYNFV